MREERSLEGSNVNHPSSAAGRPNVPLRNVPPRNVPPRNAPSGNTASGNGPSGNPSSRSASSGNASPRNASSGNVVYTANPAARRTAAGTASSSATQSQTGKKSRKKKKGSWFGRLMLGLLKLFFAFCCLGIMVVSVAAVAASSYLAKETANDDALLDLDNLKLSYSSAIYVKDTETGVYYEYQKLVGEENRVWLDLKDIPELVQNAFIAAEDQNFRTHSGFSFRRNVYAVLNEVSYKLRGSYLRGTKQGASTIDQQLVKNLLDDDADEGSAGYLRKVREIFRAYVLEKRYSKDMILEAYLNVISLTGNTAGVEAGAQGYFGKSVSQLSVAEVASLACITKNPTQYNPWTHPDDHIDRRDYVLQCMWEQGYISESEYKKALATPLKLYDPDTAEVLDQTDEETGETTGNKIIQVLDEETGELVDKVVPYTCNFSWFTDQVLNDVTEDLMEQKGMTKSEATSYIYNGGLKIYCTMVPEVQEAMEDVMANAEMFPQVPYPLTDDNGEAVLDENGEQAYMYPQSGMACVNYQGELVGVVGGLGTKIYDRDFNRATQGARPVGSTMKPIGVYSLGIEYDLITYSTGLYDSPIQVPASKLDPNAPEPNEMVDWPRNYAGKPTGNMMTVAHAVAQSINTVAVQVGQQVTPANSYEFLSSTLQISTLHYPNDVDNGPMNLGSLSEGISPYELAGAYMIFGNGGKFTSLHSYTTVEDRAGDIVVEPVITTVQAVSEETAYIMNRLLYNVLHGGTGNGLYVRGDMESVGKTGTTSDDKDHWFVGLTPYYSTATWWGYDEQIQLDWRNYGQHPPTLAWRAVMEKAQEGLEYKEFPTSDGVVTCSYCPDSGCLAGPNCPSAATGYYKADGRQPDAICGIHGIAAPEPEPAPEG